MRLIDANKLIKTLRELEWITDNPCDGDNVLEDIIDNAPTIEPITNEDIKSAINEGFKNGYEMAKAKFGRPHGEWLWLGDSLDTKHRWSCNKCGRGVKEEENFCPNCGADMRKEAENE